MKKYICPNCESRNTKPYCNDCDCSIPNDSFIEEEEKEFSYIKITNDPIDTMIRCPCCDKKINNKKRTCPYCGTSFFNGTKYKTAFSVENDVQKIFKERKRKLENNFAEAYGMVLGYTIIGGAVIYLIISLLVKVTF